MHEELQEIQQGQKQNCVPVISISTHTAEPKSLGRSSAEKDQGLLVDVWLKQWTLDQDGWGWKKQDLFELGEKVPMGLTA